MSRKYLRKEEATRYGWYSKKELKELFRLKPAKGQRCVGEVWQGQGTYDVYEKSDCVAMRPYRKPSAKQLAALAAGRECLGTYKCKSTGCEGRISKDYEGGDYCCRCLEEQRVTWVKDTSLHYANHKKPIAVLDTETTGLGGDAEIVEIAIIDWDGKTLLDTLVKPSSPIPADASAIHGIFDSDVKDAPSFAEIFEQVQSIYEAHLVLIYNADFDNRLVEQSAAGHGIKLDTGQYSTGCLMELYARYFGEYSHYHRSYKWQSLATAAYFCGVEWKGQAHRAQADCLAALGVFKHMLAQEL